jgi:hypothetical protein
MEITTIVASIITALATIASVLIGRKCMTSKSLCPVSEDTAHSTNVYTALSYTMEEMGADRAYVLEFHNGGHYYSGRGQQKFSCTHEIAEEGISRECDHSQEHRVSNYHDYITELINNKEFKYLDINDVPDSSFLFLLKRSGVQSIYNVPIKTLNGKIIGILGVDFVKGAVNEFTVKQAKLINSQSKIIAGYLV